MSPSTILIPWSTLEGLKYVAASKRILRYTYHPDILCHDDNKLCQQWSIVTQMCSVTTMLDGIETSTVAYPGDFVLYGQRYEKYVVPFKKMGDLYERAQDDPKIMVVLPQTRMVACYTGKDGMFVPAWGGQMVLKNGDYIVKEATNKYYRIEKNVFHDTYELHSA